MADNASKKSSEPFVFGSSPPSTPVSFTSSPTQATSSNSPKKPSKKDRRNLKGSKKFSPQPGSAKGKSNGNPSPHQDLRGADDSGGYGGGGGGGGEERVIACTKCTLHNSLEARRCSACHSLLPKTSIPKTSDSPIPKKRIGAFNEIEVGDVLVFVRKNPNLSLHTGIASLGSASGMTVTSADASFGSPGFWSDFIPFEGMSLTRIKKDLPPARPTTSTSGMSTTDRTQDNIATPVKAPLSVFSSPPGVETPEHSQKKHTEKERTWLVLPNSRMLSQSPSRDSDCESLSEMGLVLNAAISRIQGVARGGFARRRVWWHKLGLRAMAVGDPILFGINSAPMTVASFHMTFNGDPKVTREESKAPGAARSMLTSTVTPPGAACQDTREESDHQKDVKEDSGDDRGDGGHLGGVASDAESGSHAALEATPPRWPARVVGGTIAAIDLRRLRVVVSVKRADSASQPDTDKRFGRANGTATSSKVRRQSHSPEHAKEGGKHRSTSKASNHPDESGGGCSPADATLASSPKGRCVASMSVLAAVVLATPLVAAQTTRPTSDSTGAFLFQPTPSPGAPSPSHKSAEDGGSGSGSGDNEDGDHAAGQPHPVGPQRWLLLPKRTEAVFHAAAVKVQALARRMITEFSELPLARQEARRSWVASRAQHLDRMGANRRAKLTNEVSRQLSALPRPLLGSRSSSGSSSSRGGGGGPRVGMPDKQHLVELRERLDNTVGLGVVKAWIEKTVEDALRFCMAGEKLPVRHVLLSGRLGTGRRTAAELIAKTLRAVGLLNSDQLVESWGRCRPGCACFIDHIGEDASKGEEQLKDIGKELANLEPSSDQQQGIGTSSSPPSTCSLSPSSSSSSSSSSSGSTSQSVAPVVVILASRDARALSTLAGRVVSLQKREPHRLSLPSFSTKELAQVTLQRVAGKLSVESGVTLELVQLAIESRWSPGEREQRNVYIAFDMAEYLLHSAIIKETQHGRGNDLLVASRQSVDKDQSKNSNSSLLGTRKSIPVEVEALMNGFGRDQSGASTIGVESLGLPPSLLLKETAKLNATPPSPSSFSPAAAHPDGNNSKLSASDANAVVASDVSHAQPGEEGTLSPSSSSSSSSSSSARTKKAQAAAKAAEEAAHSAAKEEQEARRSVDEEVDRLVGMAGVKKWFEEMRGKVRFAESSGNSEILTSACLNMVLTGNPGTGKTTVARLLFRFLRAYGVLKRDVFVECNALELKGEYVGHTAPKVIATIRSALGGALFLDEAYALSGDGSSGGKADVFSNEAVRTLLTEVENNRTSVMVILAGYREKMSTLMRADPGMPRRFPIKHHLPDYSPEELTRIAQSRALQTYGMEFGPGVGFTAEELVAAKPGPHHAQQPANAPATAGGGGGGGGGGGQEARRRAPRSGGKLAEAFSTVLSAEVAQHNGGLAVRVVDEAMGRFATRMDRQAQRVAAAREAKARARHEAAERRAAAAAAAAADGEGGGGAQEGLHDDEAADVGEGKEEEEEEQEEEAEPRVLTIQDFDLEDHFERLERDARAAKAEAEGRSNAAQRAEAEERREAAAARQALQDSAMNELKGLVGMQGAKDHVRKLVAKMEFVKRGGNRRVLDTCMNLVLTGNPGTGKTTFSRILHKVLFAHGVLKEDIFVEKNALQLKGQYVGQTSPLVSDCFAAAKGGTLFLDEAPALVGARGNNDDVMFGASGGRDAFAHDAVATLLTEVENHRTCVMVVLAGYTGPMNHLLDADPGLRRRFPSHLHLPDYGPGELAAIADKAARERFGLTLGPRVQEALARAFTQPRSDGGRNAHHIRSHSSSSSSSDVGRYAGEVASSNASLPLRLVELALSKMAERVVAEEVEAEEEAAAAAASTPQREEGDFLVVAGEDGAFDLSSPPLKEACRGDMSTLQLVDFDLTGGDREETRGIADLD